jgi:hypothetical protein
VVLVSKLVADIVNGCFLVYKSCVLSSIRLLLSGVALVVITSFAAWTSFVYNSATATADTELVYTAVIVLFVNELDEVFYALLTAVAPLWLKNRIGEIDLMSSTSKVDVSSSVSPPCCRHNQEEIAKEIHLDGNQETETPHTRMYELEDQYLMDATAASFPSPPHFEQEQIETAKDTDVEQNDQEIDIHQGPLREITEMHDCPLISNIRLRTLML